MSRGGKRKGAGRKNSWSSNCPKSETVTIRVPRNIREVVWQVAHLIDEGKNIYISGESLQSMILKLRKLKELIKIREQELCTYNEMLEKKELEIDRLKKELQNAQELLDF